MGDTGILNGQGAEHIQLKKQVFLAGIVMHLIMVFCISEACMAEDTPERETDRTIAIIAEEVPDEEVGENGHRIEAFLDDLSLEEKVAQLFMITPEALTGVEGVTAAGPITEEAFNTYPVGGIIYMEGNIQSWEQTSEMLSSMQKISRNRTGLPAFLALDEEGGTVRRVSGRIENVPYVSDMYSIGSTGDIGQAYLSGSIIGDYLGKLGFNVDFAPVADVLSNPDNSVIGIRAFGSDPNLVAGMVSMEVSGLRDKGICATLKHFPGHGNTYEDSHVGLAVSYKTREELENCEFLPFKSGIQTGAEFVMAGHIAVPNVTGDDTPASLSFTMLSEILREDLAFDGIIITDALNMGAIVNTYGSGEAAVKAFLAGADMILMPGDFHSAYDSMVEAVRNGKISSDRLDASLRRIIDVKLKTQK